LHRSQKQPGILRFERPIFGTIRYMSGNSARKKFDAEKYIEQMAELAGVRRQPEGSER